jgi:PAS domain S-box-containing protein
MFEVSSVGKIETECESGRFLRANAAMCKFMGYSEEELLATTAWDITPISLVLASLCAARGCA